MCGSVHIFPNAAILALNVMVRCLLPRSARRHAAMALGRRLRRGTRLCRWCLGRHSRRPATLYKDQTLSTWQPGCLPPPVKLYQHQRGNHECMKAFLCSGPSKTARTRLARHSAKGVSANPDRLLSTHSNASASHLILAANERPSTTPKTCRARASIRGNWHPAEGLGRAIDGLHHRANVCSSRGCLCSFCMPGIAAAR